MENTTVISWIIIMGFSYFLGSISTSIIMSNIVAGVDIREYGSKNAGTTNALRVMGKKVAAAVLLGDFVKGAAAAVLGRVLMSEQGAFVAALCCVIGHIYPAMFKFRGGKGIATAAGAILALDWRIFIVLAVVFFAVVFCSKMVSAGSLSAVVAFFIATPLIRGFNPFEMVIVTVICLLIAYKHKDNIKRLRRGEESKLSFKKEDDT